MNARFSRRQNTGRTAGGSDIWVLNKPYGVICQFSPHDKHPTLKNYVREPNVYPAGRLDTDSEGLLLLTDNGKIQAAVSHPHHKMEKTYWAQVEGSVNETGLSLLRGGVDLGDFVTAPAKVRVLAAEETDKLWPRVPPIRERKSVPDFWLEIRISEGKNRQVRRMCARAGWPCLRLVRVSIGPLDIFDLDLRPGEYRRLPAAVLRRQTA